MRFTFQKKRFIISVMKSTLKKLEEKAGEILLTALVAVGMSIMQNILKQHGVECGPQLDPVVTGQIGIGASGAKIAFQTIKNLLA